MGVEYFETQEDMDSAFEDEMERLQNIAYVEKEIDDLERELQEKREELDELKNTNNDTE